eukprot:2343958-Amphidinium_carterae.1
MAKEKLPAKAKEKCQKSGPLTGESDICPVTQCQSLSASHSVLGHSVLTHLLRLLSLLAQVQVSVVNSEQSVSQTVVRMDQSVLLIACVGVVPLSAVIAMGVSQK